MPSTNCLHTSHHQIAEAGYRGSVARDENRAAHGNVCVTDECLACGARRARLINGRHEEAGTWGPDAACRRAAAINARRQATRAIAAVPAIRLGESHLTVDEDGMICVDGGPWDGAAYPAPAAWLRLAEVARRAAIRAVALEAEVTP